MSKVLRDIPAEAQETRSWHVIVNGEVIAPIEYLTVRCERFGVLTYGYAPGGYDTWSFREAGGGGAVVLPFCERDSVLLVGVVSQRRDNQGPKEVLNAPRGFVDPGEAHHDAARRELLEETGMKDIPEVIDLGGTPANPNSTFFETTDAAEGVRFYAVRIDALRLHESDGELRLESSQLDLAASINAKMAEAISKTTFIPWQMAAKLGDMFTNAAVARLLAYRQPLIGR